MGHARPSGAAPGDRVAESLPVPRGRAGAASACPYWLQGEKTPAALDTGDEFMHDVGDGKPPTPIGPRCGRACRPGRPELARGQDGRAVRGSTAGGSLVGRTTDVLAWHPGELRGWERRRANGGPPADAERLDQARQAAKVAGNLPTATHARPPSGCARGARAASDRACARRDLAGGPVPALAPFARRWRSGERHVRA